MLGQKERVWEVYGDHKRMSIGYGSSTHEEFERVLFLCLGLCVV